MKWVFLGSTLIWAAVAAIYLPSKETWPIGISVAAVVLPLTWVTVKLFQKGGRPVSPEPLPEPVSLEEFRLRQEERGDEQ